MPVERYLFAAKGDYEVTDGMNFFFEGTFNRTTSSRIIEPFAFASDGSTGAYPATGRAPIENYVTRDTNGDGVIDPSEVGQVVVNPLVPGLIAADATDTDGDGLRDIGFARRLVEFGPRSGETSRNFYRFVVGLDGTFADERFRWDVSYNYGKVTENQKSEGQINVVNFRNAFAAIPELDADGNPTGEVVCADPEARANGCVPANIFGFDSLTSEAVDYIAAPGSLQTDIGQQVIQGNLSGSLFELPAGDVGIAVGGEYRRETSSEDWDALTNQGLNAGNLTPDTSGEFNVAEAFGEIRVPILADQPFFQLLEVGGAFRYSHYSTVGNVYSYSGRATWQPFDELRIRGTYSRAVRAPNIGELFSGLAQTFPSGINDPCEGVGLTGDGALGDNCRAAPGVIDNINANGTFTISQQDRQGISGFNGGNPDLEEETADSFTIGAVINPVSISALRNLTLTVDYYNIKIDNVISAFPRPVTLDQCYNQSNDTFCDLVTRRPDQTSTNSAGSIEFIDAISVNAAQLKTDGIDVTLAYSVPVDLFMTGDQIYVRGQYTHVFANDYFALAGADADASAGEIGTAADRAYANVGYSNDEFRWNFTGTFIGKSNEDDQFCAQFDAEPGCVSVPAEFYLDTQMSARIHENVELYFGIDNLLDNDAPNILTNTTFNTTGTDTAADVYDPFGRRYYTGVRLNF